MGRQPLTLESDEYMKADEVKSLIRSAGFSFRKKRKTETDGEYRDAFERKALQLYRTLTDLPTNNTSTLPINLIGQDGDQDDR